MKIALYKNTTYSYSGEFPSQVQYDDDGKEEMRDEYARCSEIVEVEFPKLTTEADIDLQLNSLERTEQKVREEFQHKLDAIKCRRAELQSLTYTPA